MDEFDRLVELTIARFIKRPRFRHLKIVVEDKHNEDYYAAFSAVGRTAFITLYKPSMIDFYNTSDFAKTKSFKTFFMATIAHELVHREQWFKMGRNFKKFQILYKTNSEKMEQPACRIEMRIWKAFK